METELGENSLVDTTNPSRPGLGSVASPQAVRARSHAFEHQSTMTAVIDPRGVIIDTNAAWRLFSELNGGSSEATGVGVNYLEVCERSAADGDHGATAIAVVLRQVLRGERARLDLEYPCHTRSEDRWFRFQVAPVPLEDGLGAVVTHTDVTSRKVLERRVAIDHDEVTGVPDRRLLMRQLGDLISEADADTSLSLLLLDLDEFKPVNDRLGTAAGDELLVTVVGRMQRVLRTGDLISRFGGDEFVLVLRDTDAAAAERVMDRLRTAMARPFQVGPDVVALTASIGAATWVPGLDGTDLLLAADDAMLLDRSTRFAGARRTEVAKVVEREQLGELSGARRTDTTGTSQDSTGDLGTAHALVDAMVAYSDDLVLLSGFDGTIEWVSPASRRLVGLEPSDLVGTNGFELVHPDDRERVFADFLTIPSLGDSVRTEFRVAIPDGEVVWMEEIVTNLVDDPDVGALVGNLRNITERRLAEESVRLQAQMLAAAGQSIVAIDPAGTIIYWNDAATELLGFDAAEAVGRPIWEVVRTSAGWDDRVGEVLDELLTTGSWRGELLVRTKDGRDVPILVSDTTVYDDEGRHVATIGVSTDLTERLDSEQTSARLSAIVESSSDAIISTDLNGIIDTWNEGASAMFGLHVDRAVGTPFTTLILTGRGEQIAYALGRAALGEAVVGLALRTERADGCQMDVEMSFAPIRSGSGEITGVSAIGHDVTERVALHRQIEADRRRLADEQRCAGLGSFEIDLVTGDVTRSDELCRIYGLPLGTSGPSAREWMHPDDEAACTELFAALRRGDTDVSCTHRVVRPDGEVRWVISRSSDLGVPGRTITGTVLDVTEQHLAQAALDHQATHDPLTGLMNRAGLARKLPELLQACAPDRTIAAAMLDLDRFNTINDTLGHSVGDRVLQAVADRLASGLEPGDVVTRFGGDEFVVLREVDDGDDGTTLAEDVQRVLAAAVPVGHRTFHLSGCVGVAVAGERTAADALLRDADAAMYVAKRSGSSRIATLDPAARALAYRRLSLETALAQAICQDELRLEYQPVVDLQRGSLAGFEALLRWTNSTYGEVSPAEFVPIAEASDLIAEIGEWVLRTATQQLGAWRSDGLDERIWVAINVSARQLDRPDLASIVLDSIESAGVPSTCVHLEVTESAVLAESASSSDTLDQLRSSGIRVSIDDFGTGYSSLSYVDRLPVDTLKIDREFVQKLDASQERSAIVRTIIALADTLGLDAVAEGVETAEQAETLRDLGCTYGQGFWWSASLPPDRAATWTDAHAGGS